MDDSRPSRPDLPDIRTVFWVREPPVTGHCLARVEQLADGSGWLTSGAEVVREDGRGLACSFEVRLDQAWRTRSARVRALAEEQGEVSVLVDPEGRWWVDDHPRPDLDGCTDLDVAATPLTNTYPIRRFADLPVGASRTAPVAWVEVPRLVVHRVEQTYTRLPPVAGRAAWEYADPTHGAFTLTVDDDGLVVDYAGFATRL